MALNSMGSAALSAGSCLKARALLQEGLTLARSLGENGLVIDGLVKLSWVVQREGHDAGARGRLQAALALAEESKDSWRAAWVLNGLGDLARSLGAYAAAAGRYEAGRALSRKLGRKHGEAVALLNLAHVARLQADLGRSAVLFKESMALAREHGGRHLTGMCLAGLGTVAVAKGQPERAAQLLGAGEVIIAAVGTPLADIDRAAHETAAAGAREALGEAAFAAAWGEGEAMALEEAVAFAEAEPWDHGIDPEEVEGLGAGDYRPVTGWNATMQERKDFREKTQ
jgi:hypothetical protein